MMKVGIDVVEISRFSQSKDPERFQERVFTQEEISYFSKKKNPYESMAGFYAVKEAFSKYLGSGVRGFSLKDISVVHDALGKPGVLFHNKPVPVEVSISHSETVAVAVVCGMEECPQKVDSAGWEKYRGLLPKRFDAMHKGDCGRVFLLAGSVGMTGAAALCGEGAMRTGSGLVTVGTPKEAQPVLAMKLTEAMTLPLDEDNPETALIEIQKQIENSDAVGIGPGLGAGELTFSALKLALENEKPLVIDADGLNVLSRHIDILKGKKCPVVLTPHPGEMSRLCGKASWEIQEKREEFAGAFAKEYGVTLLLKGKDTVIASPSGEIDWNPTGNHGMASGGMGDVLTGMIASFLGQGLKPFESAVLGAFLHGLAGDLAAEELGTFGMLAGDVVKRIPYAIKTLCGEGWK